MILDIVEKEFVVFDGAKSGVFKKELCKQKRIIQNLQKRVLQWQPVTQANCLNFMRILSV